MSPDKWASLYLYWSPNRYWTAVLCFLPSQRGDWDFLQSPEGQWTQPCFHFLPPPILLPRFSFSCSLPVPTVLPHTASGFQWELNMHVCHRPSDSHSTSSKLPYLNLLKWLMLSCSGSHPLLDAKHSWKMPALGFHSTFDYREIVEQFFHCKELRKIIAGQNVSLQELGSWGCLQPRSRWGPQASPPHLQPGMLGIGPCTGSDLVPALEPCAWV